MEIRSCAEEGATAPLERLKAVIDERMLDESALAERAGINRSVFSGLMHGRRKFTPNYDYRLCEALDLPHGFFLRGVERAAS